MNISLTPELEQFVQGKVESGLYNNASEVVREGLRLLKEQDEVRLRWREQIERGWQELVDGDEARRDTGRDRRLLWKHRGTAVDEPFTIECNEKINQRVDVTRGDMKR